VCCSLDPTRARCHGARDSTGQALLRRGTKALASGNLKCVKPQPIPAISAQPPTTANFLPKKVKSSSLNDGTENLFTLTVLCMHGMLLFPCDTQTAIFSRSLKGFLRIHSRWLSKCRFEPFRDLQDKSVGEALSKKSYSERHPTLCEASRARNTAKVENIPEMGELRPIVTSSND
jgi:hypothetical protein